MREVWYVVIAVVVVAVVALVMSAVSLLLRLGPLKRAMVRSRRRGDEARALVQRLHELDGTVTVVRTRAAGMQQRLTVLAGNRKNAP
ncbi:MAG: hypothetical protein WCA46_03225 [Actinocatenispora sp.]